MNWSGSGSSPTLRRMPVHAVLQTTEELHGAAAGSMTGGGALLSAVLALAKAFQSLVRALSL